MEICTTMPHDEVLKCFRQGKIGPFKFGPLSQSRDGRWGGDWDEGVFSLRELDDEDRNDLIEQFGVPSRLQTKVWITCERMYEGQTSIYELVSVLLKEWHGDIVLLHYGESVRVQRIGGQISLREDCLNPERLVFYKDFDWKPLPMVKE